MVEKYNNTYHRSINLKPTVARKPANYKHIHNALYARVNALKAIPPSFHVGDKVRIVRRKGTFEKGFTPNWTEEVFTITTVKASKHPTHIHADHCASDISIVEFKQFCHGEWSRAHNFQS